MAAVRRHAEAGGRVVGICNGFQVLCEAGLLPGALRRNATLSFVCRQMELEVADDGTPWTAGRAGGRDDLDPDQEQRGRLVRRPVRGAGGAALPRGPARLDRPGRGHRERRRQRDGPDAPPRGGLRPAARLDRRAAWCCAGLLREHRPTLPRHRQLGLTDDEAARIPELLGREPTDPELVMFSLMWSEHCSYKHSRPLLRGFPTTGRPRAPGPGRERRRGGRGRRDRRGAEDREPQPPLGGGALRGRGDRRGRHRARHHRHGRAADRAARQPALRRADQRPAAATCSRRSVAGIGHYGNCIGVPTVGGEVSFDDRYEESCLVNAMCVGVARATTGCCGRRPRARATRWC